MEVGLSDTKGGAAAIQKAQADLRLEYDVREERRRELEFLENGGNPLDFKFGYATSQSVQSTSLADKKVVKSGVKDTLLRTASPPGDSVESSGRPGVSEPNTADNLLFFDSENKSLEGDKYPNKRSRTSESQRSFKVNHSLGRKETEDSAIFRPYARRNRSKINRAGARSELVQSRGGHATSLSVRKEAVDVKGSDSEAGNHKTKQVPCPGSATSNGNNTLSKGVLPTNLLETENDEMVVRESIATTENSPLEDKVSNVYRKSSVDVASTETSVTGVKAHAVSASTVIDSLSAVMTGCQETNSSQLNGLEDPRGEKECSKDSAAVEEKRLDQESSHANDVEVDVHTIVDLHRVDKSDPNSMPMQNASRVEEIRNHTVGEMVNTKSEDEAGESTILTSEQNSGYQSQSKPLKVENQDHISTVALHNEKKSSESERKQQDGLSLPQTDIKVTSGMADASDSVSPITSQAATETTPCRISKNLLLEPGSTALEDENSLDDGSRKADTLMEDTILEEARIIKEKRQRIAELSLSTLPADVRMRSQWEFVLEEMAWLANDFAQERLWKMTAAMQICHRAAFTSQLKFEERIQRRNLKSLASTFANAVLQFWNSVEVRREHEKTSLGTNTETVKELKSDSGDKFSASGITEYARRFLKFMKSSTPHLQAAVPSTPEHMCDPGIVETSWDDPLTEESLFYSVPSGAMEAYRGSIESHLVLCEKSGSSMQEEVETSAYDPAEDTGYNGYNEDDEETSSYYMPGALRYRKSNNLTHKKRKNSMKYHSARSYDHGADLPHGSYTGGSNPLMGNKLASNLNAGSVLMKRIRTASKHTTVSGDTSANTGSFQDEQSSLNGGSAVQKGTEVESSRNFEKQLPCDMAETSEKPKKKGSAYEQSWHLDLMVHGEKEHRKKRPEKQLNMNGLHDPHKKQKTVKQSLENSFYNTIPSPAASQMSNMSNPNKFLKFIGGRDRGRKLKGLKISSGQHGSENPWTLFEDQALIVLVHDMGPNWELITDALKSTLKIKCIYRHPSDCKERHRILMDKTGGDGADSAEDSGNSQAYPSTLPGIPKGSARQLFQRLQGPVEEDTLKSHFETICSIGKKFHQRFVQKDARDPKQIVPVHNSQIMALSQVFPNNLNGSVLTPLDLCDTSTSGEDEFSLENSGLPILPVLSVVPASEANPSSNNLSTSASARFNIPRGSLPPEEQHRIQQHNVSGRNRQQPSLSTPAAVSGPDHGPRPPGGKAMSVNGTHRSSPLSRPGFQGVSSLAVPNTSSMLSSGMGGISNTGNIKSVGNSTLRPRGAMQHMMRMQAGKGNGLGIPALSSGFTNQTIPSVQAYPGHLSQQHQLSQQSHVLGNSLNPPLQSPNRAAGTQQQAFAIRQRQMAQRYLQQQQQFPPAGAMPPHAVPSRPQVTPISSPQNSAQSQPLASSQPLSMPSNMTQQLKPQLPVHGLGRNPQPGASKSNNHAGKQRQRQPQQQSGKQHPHQGQPTLGQQQNKPLKGGNVMHQSISVDPSHLNVSTMSPEGTEKVEATVKAMPSQPSNLVTAVNTYTESKPQCSRTSPTQAKTSPASLPLLSRHHQGKLLSDNVIQDEKSAVVPGNILSTSSLSVTPAVVQPNSQHLLLHQKQGNQPLLTSHRTVHQSHGLSKQSQAEKSQRDPQSVINTTQTDSIGVTKGVPQASVSSVRTTTVGSTAVISPPKELDLPSCDSSEKTTTVVSKLSTSITNSTGRDPVTDMAQEFCTLGHGDKAVTEREEQQLRQSPPLVERTPQISEQLIVQDPKHIPSEQQKQQPYLKTLELEAIHENSTHRPPDTKVE
ncbi:unnamed protein product [Eruca vesicaria subsp. sativa]|uniref:Chromatin modification-related protein EAF1 B-like n=1 Tax=Eruca vesicaria subsp. sativa TaxID=29727 RepID=A0ABC8L9L5_ERUVS|nr:unnamed protein product [Eruca vesicaria subsp. sativa]